MRLVSPVQDNHFILRGQTERIIKGSVARADDGDPAVFSLQQGEYLIKYPVVDFRGDIATGKNLGFVPEATTTMQAK